MNPVFPRITTFLFLLALLLAGCSVAPVQEMSDARQAIEAARQAGASLHAPEELAAAEAELSQAERALEQADYRTARHHAEASKNLALQAQKKALSQ